MPPRKHPPPATAPNTRKVVIPADQHAKALTLPLTQIRLTSQEIDELRKKAKEKYPDEKREEALNRYIRYNDVLGGLFLMDGRRYLRGPDIYHDYVNSKWKWFSVHQNLQREWQENRKRGGGQVTYSYRYINNVFEPKEVQELVVHRSERKWARPIGYQYHISSFPTEVLSRILEFLVNLPGDNTNRSLRPLREAHYCLRSSSTTPNYDIMIKDSGCSSVAYDEEQLPFVTARKLNNWNGNYWELRRIRHVGLDPCVLNVSLFRDIGARLLYQQNTFFFDVIYDTPNRHQYFPVQSLRVDEGQSIYQHTFSPLEGRNFSTAELKQEWLGEIPNKIKLVVSQIRNRVSKKFMAKWVVYDPFVNFLYKIGPKNAALLRDVVFKGRVKLHDCNRTCGGKSTSCMGCLVDILRLYVHFIKEFCPCLTSIKIYIQSDDVLDYRDVQPTAKIEEILEPFLSNQLRSIDTLQNLEVIGPEDENMSFADETIEWAQENRMRSASKLSTPIITQQETMVTSEDEQPGSIEKSRVKCGFCGGNHNYSKCHKCEFCGRPGHLRAGCERWNRS